MSTLKSRLSYVKEGLCAVFLGFFAIVSLTNPHSLDDETFRRKGSIITLLWGWPLGLICGALALYSVGRIFQKISDGKKQI